MKRTLSGCIGLSLLMLATGVQSEVIYSETPTITSSLGSDVDLGIQQARQFALSSADTARSVTWRGSYGSSNSPQPLDNFTIEFYADSSGTPGTSIGSFAVGNLVSRSDTGLNTGGGADIYEYVADLGVGVSLSSATNYWISIVNDTTSDTDDSWYWSDDLCFSCGYQAGFRYANGTPGNWSAGASVVKPYWLLSNTNVVPIPAAVDIDIQPFDTANEVQPSSDNPIIVAVHSTNVADGDAEDFDATQVDPATLKFGIGEAPNVAVTPWVQDLDGDSDSDVMFAFRTQDTGIFCGDTEATLTGETYASAPFTGTDSVTTTDCVDTGCHP